MRVRVSHSCELLSALIVRSHRLQDYNFNECGHESRLIELYVDQMSSLGFDRALCGADVKSPLIEFSKRADGILSEFSFSRIQLFERRR